MYIPRPKTFCNNLEMIYERLLEVSQHQNELEEKVYRVAEDFKETKEDVKIVIDAVGEIHVCSKYTMDQIPWIKIDDANIHLQAHIDYVV